MQLAFELPNANLRILVFTDGEYWIAQGIEHDICVQSKNADDLFGRFEIAVRMEEENGRLDHIGPAPRRFKKWWWEALIDQGTVH